jgi:hypothetical protein
VGEQATIRGEENEQGRYVAQMIQLGAADLMMRP